MDLSNLISIIVSTSYFVLQLVSLALEPGVTREDVIGEISILFIAGHETTAHTLSFFIYALCNDVMGLQRENQVYNWPY